MMHSPGGLKVFKDLLQLLHNDILVTMGLLNLLYFLIAVGFFKVGLCDNTWDSFRNNLQSSVRGGNTDYGAYAKVGLFLYPSPHDDTIHFRSAFPQSTVTVQCNEADLVVMVDKDLFGNGQLIKEADVTLGSAGCNPTFVNTTTVAFQYGLQECGSTLKMTSDSFVYNTNVYHKPTTRLSIIRTNGAVIPIQCHYPRKDNVSSDAIKPTWVPFRSTVASEQRMNFSLRLMNDDWSTQRTSTEFYLGDVLHIEASVSTDNHVPLRLFIDSCVATLQEDETSNPRYSIIGNYGCLADSKLSDSSSAFKAPRPRDNTLQFDLAAFRFFKDSRNLMYITCHLKAIGITLVPDATSKACSYIKPGNFWSAVDGFNNICSCCDGGNCGPSARSKQLRTYGRKHGKRNIVGSEASIHLGPIHVKNSLSEPLETKMAYTSHQNFYGSVVEAMSFAILGAGVSALCAAVIIYVKHRALL
ncbi:zona pellucida sperm-binding protein 3-like [Protopterus annectens]|uniref:zona pellucida sperm-binding protein 3-like n=1 Tax=Protopterus annectens TaxID=7888 RepID=UPI001CFAF22F|nr:zona pellucida sperm-binding protein 3-like [Protopterus annectens]